MITIDIEIEYATGLTETVKAEPISGGALVNLRPRDAGVWVLAEHAGFCPLAPGDEVRVDAESRLVGLVHTEPLFVYLVHCHLPAGTTFGKHATAEHPARVAMEDLERTWRRDAQVSRLTPYTFVISAPSEQWYLDNVANHPYVEFAEMIRNPATVLDLPQLLANPTFGEMEM